MTQRALTQRAALVGAAAGIGLWASGGSLDYAAGEAGRYRVAMLPPWWLLVVLAAACAVGAVAIVGATRRLGRGETAARAALDALWPLVAAALLVAPYLPWLPDVLPMLVMLAGPGVWIWWGVLTGHVVVALWTAAAEARRTMGAESAPPEGRDLTPAASKRDLTPRRRRWTTAVLLASVIASGALAAQFMRTPLFPGGDEPHYLVIAQSLWRDGDLRIENNHQRRDYDEYFHRDLAPHYLTRGVDREIYSIHPIGMPVLMTPVYAAGGYEAVVWAFVLLGAIALTLAWRLAWAVTGSAAAATFGWATLAGGIPWVFNTFSIYPEIPAATAVLVAFTTTAGWRAGRPFTLPGTLHPARFVTAGVALGLLPWLSTKYVVMAGVLGLVVLARLWLPWPADAPARRRALWRTLAVGLPSALSLAGWFLFFHWIWGTWSPAAPYGSQRETRLEYLPQGGPGLLFDQEYGIVLAAPALLLALPGLWRLLRVSDRRRRLALELMATWAGLLAVVGAFHIWWGGSAIVGRPVVAALPLLVVAVAAQFAGGGAARLTRAAQFALLWLGFALTALVALAQNGLLLVAGRDGSSQVLEYLAPSSNVWTLLPSFLRQPPVDASLLALTWGGALLVAGLLTRRVAVRRPISYGRAAAWSSTLSIVVVALVSGLTATLLPASTPPRDVDERARVRLLDEFDATARPVAIAYTPLTLLDADDVPGRFALRVNDAGRTAVDRDTQLFGQRLSLPAGRYGLDVVLPPGAPAVDGTIALQVGRAGPAYQSWTLEMTPPGTWGRAFELPVDAGFVGIKVTPDVAAAGPRIRLTPQHVVSASARPTTRGVLGSARYGDLQVFVHGEDAWPERDGLWVRGRTTAELTVRSATLRPLTLDVRAGARPVEVVLALGSESRQLSLSAGETTTVSFPADDGARSLSVTTSDGFVPADVEPGSRDRRLLGCWITFR